MRSKPEGSKKSESSISGIPFVDPRDLKYVPNFPDIRDLSKRLRFSPQQGRIMLDDRRMILLHVSSLGILRRELIDSVGIEAARGILTRIGYLAGAKDAELNKKVRRKGDTYDVFLIGPQLLSLEGVVYSEPLNVKMDVERGSYFGEWIWRDSSENEAHIGAYGIGSAPVCWMQIGYACGFTSTFMGKPILYREVECRGMGHEFCRVIGKPMDEWDDAEEDARFLQVGDFATSKSKTKGKPRNFNIKPTESVNASDFGMVGISAGFNTVCHLVRKAAPTDATVIFLGESGVGKEIFANNLHALSGRADGPFVAVNCAAIPEQLTESELFGVEKGAYTGATASRPGRFERADGGTLFLDEIGTLPFTAQGKLLRVLQQGEVERVGGTKIIKVNVRVIAATNVNLRDESKAERFREDLFFRLNVFPIRVPSLRDRRDDIPLLMDWFLQRYSKRYNKDVTGFRERAVDALINYDWPGNVRELENMIERAVILADDGSALDIGHLFLCGEELSAESFTLDASGSVGPTLQEDGYAERLAAQGTVLPFRASGAQSKVPPLSQAEAALIQAALAQSKGNLSGAARMLEISRATLAYRMEKHGIESGRAKR